MVPVGGSIVYSYDKKLLKNVSEMYPGRASLSPILDLFITLLSLGKDGI
jgi:O-phospho-L-seryl-tRNASec:L-selenocysteinyl-tRNA synthase